MAMAGERKDYCIAQRTAHSAQHTRSHPHHQPPTRCIWTIQNLKIEWVKSSFHSASVEQWKKLGKKCQKFFLNKNVTILYGKWWFLQFHAIPSITLPGHDIEAPNSRAHISLFGWISFTLFFVWVSLMCRLKTPSQMPFVAVTSSPHA